MKYLIYILLFVCTFQIAKSQTGIFSINYHMAIPSLDFKDYMDYTSFRGWSVEYRAILNGKIGVGGFVGYNIFHHKFDRDTYQIDNGAITGTQWRYAHVVPILAVAHYELLEEGSKLNLGVGLGLGPYFIRQEVWVGIYEFVFTQWAFGLAPEVMLRYNFNETVGLTFATKYDVAFNGEQANFNDEKNHLGMWDFRFGLTFMF